MTEHDEEPIPGLPGKPPPGERILWRGSPDWRVLARTAMHTRAVTLYFALLAALALANAVAGSGSSAAFTGVAVTVAGGAAAVGLLNLLAWAIARSTIYTLTNRRVVIRAGVALPKCLNLPLSMIGSVALAERGTKEDGGAGDVALATNAAAKRLGYIVLWPHVRPWRMRAPQPMLRAVPDAAGVAARIGRACLALQSEGVLQPVEARPAEPVREPDRVGAMAA